MRGDNDTLLDTLTKAAPYFDLGWERTEDQPFPPSKAMVITYCMGMTAGNEQVEEDTQARARFWLAEARRRWREGYFPNPLDKSPKKRPIVASAPA